MNESSMNILEEAARVLMGGPNLDTIDERRNAEHVILKFRKTKTSIRTCKQILGKSKVAYLQFEAAEVIKIRVLREWNSVSFSDKKDLVQYLFGFVVTRDLPCFVRDKILVTLSTLVKRISADDNGKHRHIFLYQVEDLINTAEYSKKIIGCQLLSILMQEYATTCKSSDLGLPWEVHNNCKKQFEATDLIRIFKFIMGLLEDIGEIDISFPQEIAQFTRCLLQIAEGVFVWSYNTVNDPERIVGQYAHTCELELYPGFLLTVEWKDVILAPELVPLMFTIYWKVRFKEELSHHVLTCLVQLASVTAVEGTTFYDDDAKVAYLRRYLENFSKLLSSVNIDGKEALGISSIAEKLSFYYHHEIVNGLTINEQRSFLDEMTMLACHFCEKSVSDECDDGLYEDCFERMLHFWLSLHHIVNGQPNKNILLNFSTSVFTKYVQSKLGPPSGFRKNSASKEENIGDLDQIECRDQLKVIGVMGRSVLSYTLPMLYKLLEHTAEQLRSILQLMEVRPLTLEELARMESIFEDLHWCLLISGHVVTMDDDGETPGIPTEVMVYSSEHTGERTNLEATLETLEKSGDLHWVNLRIDQCDDVIRLFAGALKICAIEDLEASIKLGHFMSPLVSCTLMWFIKKFCTDDTMTLLPAGNSRKDPYAFRLFTSNRGTDSAGASHVAKVIISKVKSNIVNFHTKPVLLQHTVELFCRIVSIKIEDEPWILAEAVWDLVAVQNEIEAGHLPPQIRRGLYRAFAIAISLRDDVLSERYIRRLFEPIRARFDALLSNRRLISVDDEQVQNELVDIIECLIGVSSGATTKSSKDIFDNMYPIVEAMLGLFETYYNYQRIVQSVLELLCQYSKSLISDELDTFTAITIIVNTTNFVEEYEQCHINRMAFEPSAGELIVQDLPYIMDYLNNLLPRKWFRELYVTVVFSRITRLLTRDLLKYPNLCLRYYRLLANINDYCLTEIFFPSFDYPIVYHILETVQNGLFQISPEITHICLDFISRLCGLILKFEKFPYRIYDLVRPFVKVLLDHTLSIRIGGDLLSSVGEAVYLLICCYPEEMLVQMLKRSQGDPQVSYRLAVALDRMRAGIQFNNKEISKIKFKSSFEKFVHQVRGFLLIK